MKTRISSNRNYIRGFSAKDKTPIIEMQAKQISINMISSITNKGTIKFKPYEKYIKTETLIEFTKNSCK